MFPLYEFLLSPCLSFLVQVHLRRIAEREWFSGHRKKEDAKNLSLAGLKAPAACELVTVACPKAETY